MKEMKQKNCCEFFNATFVIAVAAFVISLALVGALGGLTIKVIRKISFLLNAKHGFTASRLLLPISNSGINSTLVG